jgi:hypothetical protein
VMKFSATSSRSSLLIGSIFANFPTRYNLFVSPKVNSHALLCSFADMHKMVEKFAEVKQCDALLSALLHRGVCVCVCVCVCV